MTWYDDGYGIIRVQSSLQPIRSRKMASLERQMKELIIEADAYKAQLKAAQIQVEAYKAGIGTLQDTFRLITDIN